jgi:hypothetical protein
MADLSYFDGYAEGYRAVISGIDAQGLNIARPSFRTPYHVGYERGRSDAAGDTRLALAPDRKTIARAFALLQSTAGC